MATRASLAELENPGIVSATYRCSGNPPDSHLSRDARLILQQPPILKPGRSPRFTRR
jgi:hypothetical protein